MEQQNVSPKSCELPVQLMTERVKRSEETGPPRWPVGARGDVTDNSDGLQQARCPRVCSLWQNRGPWQTEKEKYHIASLICGI